MKVLKLLEPNNLVSESSEPTQMTEERDIKVKIEELLFTRADYEIYCGNTKQKYPFVIGRNAVGVVSEVRNKERSMLQKMDRVAIEPYIPCGCCAECVDGDFRNCSDMQELGHNCDGLMQNFIDLPYSVLHSLPDNLSNEKALFVSYVSFCLNIIDSLKLEKGRHIAVFSTTKTGLILAQLIAYYQAIPVFISNRKDLLKTARDMGIFYVFNTETCDIEREILTVTSGRMCKELVLFSDSDFSMKDVYNAAAMNATVCLAGNTNKENKISVGQICKKHLKIFGVFNGEGNFSSAINLLVTNKVNVDFLIGDKIKFDKVPEALAKLDPDDLVVKSKIIVVD